MASSDKKPSPAKLAERWLTRIEDVQKKDCKTWYTQAEESYTRYKTADRDTKAANPARRYNVYWSNIEVLKPSLFSKSPKINCSRRFKDKNPVGLLAAQLLERATQYSIDDGGKFGDAVKAARDDYLLAARGSVWIRYEPTYGEEKSDRIPVKLKNFDGYYGEDDKKYETGDVLKDDLGPYVSGETYKPVVNERVGVEFKHHRDLVHGPADVWDRVPWVAARHHMRKRKIADRFGKACAAQIEQQKEDELRKNPKNGAAARDTTPIWEIWDKERGQVRWVCEFYKDGFLDEVDDPLNLADFFPTPRPLFGTLTPDSLIPTPDYEQYKDQALELDRLTDRGLRLARSIRVSGVYDGSVKELQKLFNESTGDNYVAVNTFAAFADKGGLKSAMDTLPIEERVNALKALYEVRQTAKADLYEISGLSDIMRGDTDPNETLGAQKLKAGFGSKRLVEKRDDMERFIRDTVALVAEVIAEHFRPEQILKMAGAESLVDMSDPQQQQMLQQALALLKDQGARDFQIDIETDSTLAIDEETEKQTTVEFVTEVTGYLQQAALIAQASPAMMPLLLEMLMFAVRRFRAGRDLEQTFEKTVEAVTQEQQQSQANPKPSPEALKVEIMKAEASAKIDAQKQSAQVELDKAQKLGDIQVATKAQEAIKSADLHKQTIVQSEMEHQQRLRQEGELHQQKKAMQTDAHNQQLEQKQKQAEADRANQEAEAAQAAQSSAQGESDDMKVNLSPDIQKQIAQSIAQDQAARKQSADAVPQALAQTAQQLGEAVQAMTQLVKVLSSPTEIQVDKKTGKKRAVRVAA